MLNCDTMQKTDAEVTGVDVWDGNKNDTTNYKTDKYLQINSCGFQHLPAGWTVVRERGRYDCHLLFINSGEIEVRRSGETQILTKGNFVFYKPGEKQYYAAVTDADSLWLHFGGAAAEEILTSFGIDGGIYTADYSISVFETYSNLIRQFNQPELKKLANGTLLILLAHISDAVRSISPAENAEAISEILTYINMNYNKKLTIDQLAKRAGYSKSRFSHLFSELLHTAPLAYQKNIRLTNACELLSGSAHSVGEVARSCGFEDQLYFCRVFKKKYGLSPSEYRRRSRGEE